MKLSNQPLVSSGMPRESRHLLFMQWFIPFRYPKSFKRSIKFSNYEKSLYFPAKSWLNSKIAVKQPKLRSMQANIEAFTSEIVKLYTRM